MRDSHSGYRAWSHFIGMLAWFLESDTFPLEHTPRHIGACRHRLRVKGNLHDITNMGLCGDDAGICRDLGH
jgi:hypothetical protein